MSGSTAAPDGRVFKLPDLGEGVHEGHIVKVLVSAGDVVAEDQPLLEVETDKAAVEIGSPHAGTVTEVHVEAGQTVHVGDAMITFDAAAPSGAAKAPRAAERTRGASADAAPPVEAPAASAPSRSNGRGRRVAASPAVRRLAREQGIELTDVAGSGPGGRVTRADVEAVIEGGGRPTASASTVEDGRAESAAMPAPTRRPGLAETPGEPGTDAWGPISRETLSRPRRVIAETMTRSWTTIPHVTDCDDADVTELDRLRTRANGRFAARGESVKLSLLPFVLRAVAVALRRHPIFNAAYDDEQQTIVHHRYVGLALGVQTDRGLVAPVIREADRLSVIELHEAALAVTELARGGRFEPNDLRGGTFTVSNAGAMGGSRYATPIVSPGQSAVLAVGRSRLMPWVVPGADGEPAIEPRLICPLSLSFDHRIIDGAEEIAFQRTIIEALEHPVDLM